MLRRLERTAAVVFPLVLAIFLYRLWNFLLPADNSARFFDLDFYRRALAAVANGQILYEVLAYPPITLIVLSPLRGLPERPANMLWTGTSILTVIALAALMVALAMRSRWPEMPASAKIWRCSFAAIILVGSIPVLSQLTNGQLSLMVATLTFLDAAGVFPRKLRGIGVGLAAAMKLTPLIFLPHFALTRQWRKLWAAGAAFLAAGAIGFALFPADSVYFWTHADSTEVQGPARVDNLSVLGLLTRILPDPGVARWIWLVCAALIGVAAYWRAQQHFRRGEHVPAALVIGCASTAVAPIAWPHYLIWIGLTGLWLLFSPGRRNLILGIIIVVMDSEALGFVLTQIWPNAGVPLTSALSLIPVAVALFGLPARASSPSSLVGPPEASMPDTGAEIAALVPDAATSPVPDPR
jgi:Protein of unknown function (DUF2029).